MIETESRYQQADAKRLYYLSMEFLMGRSLGNNLHNLGLFEDGKGSAHGPFTVAKAGGPMEAYHFQSGPGRGAAQEG